MTGLPKHTLVLQIIQIKLLVTTVTIVGDPAWLQQGESWVHSKKGDPFYYSAFLKDGTINFDRQQILFEISYNTPNDYNFK